MAWRFNPADPHRPYVGTPYIDQASRDGYALVPTASIQNTPRVPDTGFLRAQLRRFPAEPGPDPAARMGTRLVWRLPGR